MRARGFTLLELMVTVAIVGIVAAMAASVMTAATKNARVAGVGFDLAEKLKALQTRAMRDQRDVVAIVTDFVGDPTNCVGGREECAGIYVVEPVPGFRLNDFDPSTTPWPVTRTIYTEKLGRGIRFYRRAAGRPAPPPFSAIVAFDPALVGNCGGTRLCMAVRFRGDGTVVEERPDGAPGGTALGMAFVIGSDLSEATRAGGPESQGSEQRGVFVSFPSGIVRGYAVSR